MPCEFRIHTSRNLVEKTYFGRLTTKCVLDMLDRLEEDPEYQSGMMEFDDLRAVTDLAIPPEDVARFADLMMALTSRRRTCTRKAVVTESEDVRRAVESFASEIEGNSGLEVGIFDNRSCAFAFLGVPDLGAAAAIADASTERRV